MPALALAEGAVEKLLGCIYAVADVDSFSPSLHYVDQEHAEDATVVCVVSDVSG